MTNLLKDIYELFVWWVRFFNTKREDNSNINEWLQNQIVYDNGGLQINYVAESDYAEDNIYEEDVGEVTILKFNGKNFTTDNSAHADFSGSVVDWGDGVTESPVQLTHTYEVEREHTIIIKNAPYGVVYCFRRASMNEVMIYDNITELYNNCFTLCVNLTSVIIFSDLLKMGKNCFAGCSNLVDINIPNSVTEFGDYCFNGCSSLTTINIPSNVIRIGVSCFWGSGLISINIPESVTYIGGTCFSNCSNLESIKLNWIDDEDILQYKSNWITDSNNNLKFIIPRGTSSLYISKGYPEAKLEEVSL